MLVTRLLKYSNYCIFCQCNLFRPVVIGEITSFLVAQVWTVPSPLPRRTSWSWRGTTLSWCQTQVNNVSFFFFTAVLHRPVIFLSSTKKLRIVSDSFHKQRCFYQRVTEWTSGSLLVAEGCCLPVEISIAPNQCYISAVVVNPVFT